jgi:hypothetical protein
MLKINLAVQHAMVFRSQVVSVHSYSQAKQMQNEFSREKPTAFRLFRKQNF